MKVAALSDLYDLTVLILNECSSWFLSPRGKETLARLLGDITYILRRGSRRMIADRLSAALCRELAPDQIKRLTRDVSRHRWVERLSFPAVNRKTAGEMVSIEGLEHLREALSKGKGVILWESPFGKRLLAKVALMEKGFSLCQVHGPAHGGSLTWLGQAVIRRIRRQAVARLFPEIIEIQDDSFAYLRLLVNRLKQNGIVCISGFGNIGRKFVPVEFLGAREHFATGLVSLARMTGASIILIFCFKQGNGTDHLVLERPMNLAGSGDWDKVLMRVITRYARQLESYIRKHPDQWCWFPSYW